VAQAQNLPKESAGFSGNVLIILTAIKERCDFRGDITLPSHPRNGFQPTPPYKARNAPTPPDKLGIQPPNPKGAKLPRIYGYSNDKDAVEIQFKM